MIEVPVVTGSIGDLGYLYDRRSRAHPILKRTNSFVFTDDPVSRALAHRFDTGPTGFKLKPFRIQRLDRWGFDAMNERVPYDAPTSEAVLRIGHSLLASLDYDDVPRHVAPTRGRQPANSRASIETVAAALSSLGISPNAVLTSDLVMTAFKSKVKEHHPDNGGDPVAFRNLVAARDALMRGL